LQMIYTTAGYANAGVAYSFFMYKLSMNPTDSSFLISLIHSAY